MVIAPAEAPLPLLGFDGVGEVMVAGDIEKRHLQLVDEPLEFLPLSAKRRGIFGIAFDQIAHGDDESRLHEIQLLDCHRKDTRSMAAGAIADNTEMKRLR